VHAQSRVGSADQAEYRAKYLTPGLPPKAHVLRSVEVVAVYVRRAVNRKWAPAVVFCWPGRECRRTPTFRPERGLFRRHITHQLQDVPLSSLMSAIRARATGQGYEPGCCRRRSSAMMSFGVMSDDTSTPFSFAMRARLAEVNIGVPP
jgi:hypothetical protein